MNIRYNLLFSSVVPIAMQNYDCCWWTVWLVIIKMGLLSYGWANCFLIRKNFLPDPQWNGLTDGQ